MVLFTCDNTKKRSLKQWHINTDSHKDNDTDRGSRRVPRDHFKSETRSSDEVKWDTCPDRGASVYVFIMPGADYCA